MLLIVARDLKVTSEVKPLNIFIVSPQTTHFTQKENINEPFAQVVVIILSNSQALLLKLLHAILYGIVSPDGHVVGIYSAICLNLLQ
jgi:hypothetical protein